MGLHGGPSHEARHSSTALHVGRLCSECTHACMGMDQAFAVFGGLPADMGHHCGLAAASALHRVGKARSSLGLTTAEAPQLGLTTALERLAAAKARHCELGLTTARSAWPQQMLRTGHCASSFRRRRLGPSSGAGSARASHRKCGTSALVCMNLYAASCCHCCVAC